MFVGSIDETVSSNLLSDCLGVDGVAVSPLSELVSWVELYLEISQLAPPIKGICSN